MLGFTAFMSSAFGDESLHRITEVKVSCDLIYKQMSDGECKVKMDVAGTINDFYTSIVYSNPTVISGATCNGLLSKPSVVVSLSEGIDQDNKTASTVLLGFFTTIENQTNLTLAEIDSPRIGRIGSSRMGIDCSKGSDGWFSCKNHLIYNCVIKDLKIRN